MRDVLLFDLDGTLVDSAPGIALALSRLSSARGGGVVPTDRVRPLVSLGAEALVGRALGPVAGDSAADVVAFRTILAALPADPASLYPDVSITLDALAEAGFAMGIVTNKPERLSLTLIEGLGLGRHFQALVGGDTTGRAKPHPAPLELALHRLGTTATRAIFIGDSAVDAGAARALALPFVLFERGYGAASCDRRDVAAAFDRFADLPGILANLHSAGAQAEAFPGD